MTVQQLLDRKKNARILSIDADETVYEAIKSMAKASVGALVVTSAGELVGMVSERDYARKIILLGRSSRETSVREVMSSPAITVTSKDTVQRCMELMTDRRFRHLPVVDEGTLVGLVSIGDVVASIISQQAFVIEQLESYIDRR